MVVTATASTHRTHAIASVLSSEFIFLRRHGADCITHGLGGLPLCDPRRDFRRESLRGWGYAPSNLDVAVFSAAVAWASAKAVARASNCVRVNVPTLFPSKFLE